MPNRPDLGLFSHAVVMTLDKRKASGELGSAAHEFARTGLPVHEFLVGDGQLYPEESYGWVDVPAEPRRQAFNYASAFQRILSYARVPKWDRPFLYLEDDAEMLPGWEEILPRALEELQTLVGDHWDILHVGGNHLNGRVWKAGRHLLRAEYSLDLHCIAVNWRAFPKLSAVVPSSHRTIDGVIADMQRSGELVCYGVNPPLSYQMVGWSHNEQRIDDKRDRQIVRYW